MVMIFFLSFFFDDTWALSMRNLSMRRGAVSGLAVAAACALLACSFMLGRSSPRALAATFPACAIPPCSQAAAGTEADRLATVVRGLKSKLSKLKMMMGDWSNTVNNFGKDQRMLLSDLADKRKKVTRDEHAVEAFLRTPAILLKSSKVFLTVHVLAR
jgi:hypothetical protein